MGFLSEFKKFALRGNVIDMAVGIIVGGAFGTVVNSLVKDVVMPPIGMLLGGVDFADLAVTLKQAVGDTPAVTIKYGVFFNALISFLIVAFAVFIMVKAINKLESLRKPATPAAPVLTADQKLLTEIRDLLKNTRA
jgi:large conductance mechanosensitive channel